MDTLKASQARIPTEAFDRVVRKGERIRIQHRSAGTVVLVCEEDAELLEALEDRLDAEEAARALREFRESGQESIPYETVRKDLGLE